MRAEPKNYTGEIANGFICVMETLKEHKEEIRRWLVGIQNCVARSVIFPTFGYYARLNEVYSRRYVKADPSNADLYVLSDPFLSWKTEANLAYAKCQDALRGGIPGVQEVWLYFPWPNTKGADGHFTSFAPIYALQTQKNDFMDYLNCDIPAYYHRLNSKNLLNARGEKVDINIDGLTPGRPGYFPESTFDIVMGQLEELRDEDPGKDPPDPQKERINACAKQLKEWLGIPAPSSRL